MNTALQSIPFYQDTIFIVDQDGEPFVPVKPLCENMGLDWAAQFTKLKAKKKRLTIAMIATVAEDGKQRKMICIPLRKIAAWLYSISPEKVAPHLKEKIETYQNECDEVLWNYWTKGMAVSDKIAASHIMVENKKYIHLLEYYHTGRGKNSAPAVTADESAAMKKAILAGMTSGQVAKKYGRARSTVQKHTRAERTLVAVRNSGQMGLPFTGQVN